MMAYKYLMKSHQIQGYRACATSAMRESKNGREVAKLIKEKTGIKIDIIEGKEEARIIHTAHFKDKLDPSKNFIYIDVGGGSTEITLFSKGKVIDTQSFNIGTIRLLNNMVSKEEWNNLKKWIKHQTIDIDDLETIGSGGNINKLYKLSKVSYPKPLKHGELVQIHNLISDMSIDERIKSLKLNPDRADVIIPASTIFVNVMKWAKSKTIHVPKIGLADGLIMDLAERKAL
jgi:exopolyphosphatase/guanosine-5'-triphosphate,3'-diphosphate pyrophosphatase